MTQTAARHGGPEDLGDPEPVGLASGWTDEPPARRALPAEDSPHFQATPVRVDEAFPEYEAYHSVIEFPSYDAVAPASVTPQSEGWGDTQVVALQPVPRAGDYGWVAGSLDPQHQPPVAPGLVPYPMAPEPQLLTDSYTIPAPVPAAYALAATPNPYQTMALDPQPMGPDYATEFAPTQPSPYALPDMYATAAPPSPYDIETSGTQNDVALMAVGGTFMVLKKVLSLIPFLMFAGVLTFLAMTMGGTILWALAGFSWLSTLVALFGRRVTTTDAQRQKNVASMVRMYLGK